MKKLLFISILLTYANANTFEENKQACENGSATGCFLLGFNYSNGKGVRQDKLKALELYKQACAAGNADGCYSTGLTYFVGDSIRQNKLMAKEYYGKACDKGMTSGCTLYRILNEQGVK